MKLSYRLTKLVDTEFFLNISPWNGLPVGVSGTECFSSVSQEDLALVYVLNREDFFKNSFEISTALPKFIENSG